MQSGCILENMLVSLPDTDSMQLRHTETHCKLVELPHTHGTLMTYSDLCTCQDLLTHVVIFIISAAIKPEVLAGSSM